MNTQNSTLNILFIGDIVGRSGRKVVKAAISEIKRELDIDFVIANAENSASGFGITLNVYKELAGSGIDAFTSGNHIYDKKEFIEEVSKFENLVRPANFPLSSPGKPYIEFEIKGIKLLIVNLIGRIFMPLSDCPFNRLDDILQGKNDFVTIVDFHAEATSEKNAFAYYFDGKVAAILGTHTHVQTNDDRILPGGTLYITDVGMCGALDSCIGVVKENSIERFLTAVPVKFDVEKKGKMLFNAMFFKLDKNTKRVVEFKKIYKIYGE
ncbi:MAG: 2,3-cyclic-nucleotide 2-phosphodiesterase [Deferribacteres bacterium]|nr:2,3-cyclic-nucleotide 2-phosphodiesterase [Deferribacteres bacterium]